MSNTLNLNAKRAARAAARGEASFIELEDERFELVNELPITIGELAMANKVPEALRAMLAHPNEDWDRLMRCRPSYEDVMDVVEFFGARLGESLKSHASSRGTGTPSRSTSDASTAESLAVTSTGQTPLAPVS